MNGRLHLTDVYQNSPASLENLSAQIFSWTFLNMLNCFELNQLRILNKKGVCVEFVVYELMFSYSFVHTYKNALNCENCNLIDRQD